MLAGGAINTPALLLRAHAGAGSGQVGRRTFLHPTVPIIAFYDQPVEAFYGRRNPSPFTNSPIAAIASATSSRRRPSTRCWPRWPSRGAATPTVGSCSASHTRRPTIALLVDGHHEDAAAKSASLRQARPAALPLPAALKEAAVSR